MYFYLAYLANIKADLLFLQDLGILLRGGNFTISEVKEVVGRRLLVGDITYRNSPRRLINMYIPVVQSEQLAVLQQLPLLLKVKERQEKLSKLQKSMQNLLLLQTMGVNITEDLKEVKSQQASLFASEAEVQEVLDNSMRERLDQTLFLDELTNAGGDRVLVKPLLSKGISPYFLLDLLAGKEATIRVVTISTDRDVDLRLKMQEEEIATQQAQIPFFAVLSP
eukprot:g43705.t1